MFGRARALVTWHIDFAAQRRAVLHSRVCVCVRGSGAAAAERVRRRPCLAPRCVPVACHPGQARCGFSCGATGSVARSVWPTRTSVPCQHQQRRRTSAQCLIHTLCVPRALSAVCWRPAMIQPHGFTRATRATAVGSRSVSGARGAPTSTRLGARVTGKWSTSWVPRLRAGGRHTLWRGWCAYCNGTLSNMTRWPLQRRSA